MPGLPRAIIRKYGVTKKAWAVYRGSKTKPKPKRAVRRTRRVNIRVKKGGLKNMARSRKRGRRSYGGGGFNLKSEFVPIAVAAVSEPIVDQYLNQFLGGLGIPMAGLQIDDVAKVGIAYMMKNKKGMLGKVVKYYGIFGARNIVQQMTGGMFAQGGATSNGNQPTF